jgi:hypothetical protein
VEPGDFPQDLPDNNEMQHAVEPGDNIRRRLAAAVSAPNACIDALRDHVY